MWKLGLLLVLVLEEALAESVREKTPAVRRRSKQHRRRLNDECEDTEGWYKLGEPSKDCSWVAASSFSRCGPGRGNAGAKGWNGEFALFACQSSCGTCGILDEEEEEADDNIETDYYVAATPETVRWGYYDLDAEPVVTIESGDTITMEVVSHHSGHDYAKMIRGDPNVEDIFAWYSGETLETKTVPKLPGSGVHIITGPVEIAGGEPGDVLQVDILSLDPRPNPETGKTYGTNSQKFAGYQFRVGQRDGEEYTRDGGDEVITVFEFVKTESGKMAWGKPIYAYTFPTIIDTAGELRTFDGQPAVVIPHVYNYGDDLEPIDDEPVEYPAGFNGTIIVSDGLGNEGVINYLNVSLNWKVPLRPHLGILGVMPANTDNYLNGVDDGAGGANSIPPSQFGGNVDDWRIGKGSTLYYKCEVEGCMMIAGDTHAAQGDSELAGTAMETSLTAQLQVTLHKADALPTLVASINYPLLETSESFVIHGFAYSNYLDQLEEPSTIFAEGASTDLALEDCFNKTRIFLMDVYSLSEPESIALMSTAVDFAITQIVDGNWGVHATIPKWSLDEAEGEYTPYDYKCTQNPGGYSRRRRLSSNDDLQRRRLADVGFDADDPALADRLFKRVLHRDVRAPYEDSLKRHLFEAKAKAAFAYANPKIVPSKLHYLLEDEGIIEENVEAGLFKKLEDAVGVAQHEAATS